MAAAQRVCEKRRTGPNRDRQGAAFSTAKRSVFVGIALLAAGFTLAMATSARAVGKTESHSVSPIPAGATTQPVRSASSRPFERALIIPIVDTISEITSDSIKRRLKRIEAENIPLAIFELDTPGGSLGPTLDICKMIKDLRDNGTKAYAWVNTEAYSAGTIIALATDGIVMARNATIGDCQPIMITGVSPSAIPEDIEAKATSPLLAELRDSARRNRYPLNMVMALIRPEVELFWVEDTQTKERRFVNAHERNTLFGLEDTDDPNPVDEDSKDDKSSKKRRTPTEPVPDSQSKTTWRYVAQAPDMEKVRQPIDDDRELLTMRTVEATAYGFSLATVNSQDDLRSCFHVSGPIDKMDNTWMENFVEWLASPTVRGVLFLLMLLGAYTEFQAPGLSVPGVVALVALILFLGAPYMAGFTVTWEIAIILLGVGLLMVEIFVFPGLGVAGFLGVLFVVVGLLASFVPAEPSYEPGWFQLPKTDLSYDYLKHGLYSLAAGLSGGIVGMVLIARYFPRVPVAGRIIAPNPDHAAVQMADPYEGVALVGDLGQAESLLRPAGKARFGDRLVDVVSEGDYIPKGTRLEVVERHGNRVVVRPTPQ